MKISYIVKYFFVRVINMKAWLWCLFLAVAIHISVTPVRGQEVNVSPSKSDALDAWDSGNYETAYDHFNGLLLLYSRDPLYKYYTGACLVRLQRDVPRAVTLLGSAINSSLNVKSVPDDVWFFYGRALQMSGSFPQAAEAYTRFAKIAGRKAAQGYGVQTYLDECAGGKGALSTDQRAGRPELRPKALTDEVAAMEAGGTDQQRSVSGTEEKAQSTADRAQRQVSELPGGYEEKLTKAVTLQHEADSISRIARGVREAIDTTTPEKSSDLVKKAGELDESAAFKQAEADSIFLMMEPKEISAPQKTEAQVKIISKDIFYQFEIRRQPAYSNVNPIPVDTGVPDGLVYLIQVAAFRNTVSPAIFKGLYPLYGRKKAENGVTYYYAGMFRQLDGANQALPKVRAAGFSDAFVIALMDNTQISTERAALLEKEWAAKPLFKIEAGIQKNESTSAIDTLPVGTLTFRAEVMRSDKPFKPEVIEKMVLLAGKRGYDIIKNNEGENVFLIGNFITFESADDYVSLLMRNGYSTARVAAYVGKQEIPVEAAKELLKQLQDD
jgi:hypothetical protein